MQKFKFLLVVLGLITGITQLINAQATFPANDVANPKDGCYAFTNATIVKSAKDTLTNATMVIRQGKIETVGTNITIPRDAVVIDCRGKYIYPAFIDIYSDYGIPGADRPQAPGGIAAFFRTQQITSNTKGAYGWNQAIKSEPKRIKFLLQMMPKQKH